MNRPPQSVHGNTRPPRTRHTPVFWTIMVTIQKDPHELRRLMEIVRDYRAQLGRTVRPVEGDEHHVQLAVLPPKDGISSDILSDILAQHAFKNRVITPST